MKFGTMILCAMLALGTVGFGQETISEEPAQPRARPTRQLWAYHVVVPAKNVPDFVDMVQELKCEIIYVSMMSCGKCADLTDYYLVKFDKMNPDRDNVVKQIIDEAKKLRKDFEAEKLKRPTLAPRPEPMTPEQEKALEKVKIASIYHNPILIDDVQ